MPRRQRQLHATPPRRSIVASSATLRGKRTETSTRRTVSDEWQKECYRHYRICGEARFAAQFFGHALSKATLYVASDPTNLRSDPILQGPAYDALEELLTEGGGSPALLSACGVHLTIAGECYLIGRTPKQVLTTAQKAGLEQAPPPEEHLWEIRSVMEVKSDGIQGNSGQWWIDQPGMTPARIDLTDDDTVIRIWTPDPSNAGQADSPFRSLLPILEEIEWLTRYVFAQCSSRLAGAGIWMVPEEIDFPAPPDDPTDPESNEDRSKADDLMAYLAELMLPPIADPGLPAAKVPGVITVPGEMIAAAKEGWMTFWSELDTEAKAMRQEAVQRFALGMDLPPERILGMSGSVNSGGGGGRGVNHWGSWQIDEDTIKMHVEPMLDVVVMAITRDYMSEAVSGPALIRYDTSTLRLRPDRSQEAISLYDRGLLKGSVAVKENGFDPETEMPDENEQKMWLLMKIASGSATPEMVASALQLLGVALPMPELPMPPDSQLPNESRPAPSIPPPERALPEQSALLAACDALVYRALERAGNRLRQSGSRPPGLRSFETHTAMKLTPSQAFDAMGDAWSCAEPVLSGVTDDVEAVLKKINSYTVGLLTSATPHSREALAKWMATTA